jgi:hypothetical protein
MKPKMYRDRAPDLGGLVPIVSLILPMMLAILDSKRHALRIRKYLKNKLISKCSTFCVGVNHHLCVKPS